MHVILGLMDWAEALSERDKGHQRVLVYRPFSQASSEGDTIRPPDAPLTVAGRYMQRDQCQVCANSDRYGIHIPVSVHIVLIDQIKNHGLDNRGSDVSILVFWH